MTYVKRPLAKQLVSARNKVVVLEGARAVGKTMLARRELEPLGFSYQSLADRNTYERAASSPDDWVASLRLPAIIDEAQRLNDIPLAIKEVVDQHPGASAQFILTGSASIGRSGLDGQDPLTRRSRRFTLCPLTQREIRGVSENLIDELWDGRPNPDFKTTVNRSDIRLMMSIGGFPSYACDPTPISENERGLSIRDDIDSVLGDTLLPDERLDKSIADAILQQLLTVPGRILNVSSIGKQLGYDNRTVERYLSIFINRFLVTALPNLKQPPRKQSFARAKIHPVDTSFSVEYMRKAGERLESEGDAFGAVLESYVLGQIMPAAQWSARRPDIFYWREAGNDPKEVDIVLLSNNELVGIEVKSSSSVASSDFKGLRALQKDPRFKRGFIIYMGNQVVEESETLWAIPLTALWEKDAFMDRSNPQAKNTVTEDAISAPPFLATGTPDANVFLSYHHADNEHLDGAIVSLMRAIVAEYEYLYTTTLNLFIDTDSIRWGDDWRTAIDRSLDATNFIIPAVTPRYVKSDACRDELIRFSSYADRAVHHSILSLVWQNPDTGEPGLQSDLVYQTIMDHQYKDVESLRDLEPKSNEYKLVVRDIVQELRRIIVENRAAPESPAGQQGSAEPETDIGLFEQMEKMNADVNEFGIALSSLQDHFGALGEKLSAHPMPQGGAASGYAKWSLAVASATRADLAALNKDVGRVNASWAGICNTTKAYLKVAALIPDVEERRRSLESIESSILSLSQSLGSSSEMQAIEAQISLLPALSSKLRPLANGAGSVFDTFRTIASSASELLDLIREMSE